MATYDEALFYQHLRGVAKFGAVTSADVEDAFWAASRDLEHNLTVLKPDKLDEARQWVRTEVVPKFGEVITKGGFRVVDPQ